MEGGKEQAQNVPNSEMNCCDEDGKEGHADGSSKDVPIQPESEGAEQMVDLIAEQMVDMCENGKEGKADDSSDGDDKMDGEEVEEESGAAAHVDQARGILPQIYIPPVDPHEKRDTEQHVLPRRLPTRPAITREQQREDYALLRQIESEQLRARQRAQQCANDVLDPSVRNSEEGTKGSETKKTKSSKGAAAGGKYLKAADVYQGTAYHCAQPHYICVIWCISCAPKSLSCLSSESCLRRAQASLTSSRFS